MSVDSLPLALSALSVNVALRFSSCLTSRMTVPVEVNVTVRSGPSSTVSPPKGDGIGGI